MKADTQIQTAVMNTLNEFAENYEKRDLDGVMSVFAPDSDVVLYGSGADEKRVGIDEIRAQVERDWSQSEATSFTYGWTSISSAGMVAWAAVDLTFMVKADGQEFSFDGRLTNVFENREGKWLMVQGHFSLPSATQEEGESFPT